MKLNRTYWVWIDPSSGHIWNDDTWTSKAKALEFIPFPEAFKPSLKLKKIKIVEIREKK